MEPALLTTHEVAALLRVHPKQVYRLVRRGLPARRVGVEWRFVRDEVLAWADAAEDPARTRQASPSPAADVARTPARRASRAEDLGRPPLIAANGDVAVEVLLAMANAAGGPLLGFVPADRGVALDWLAQGAVLAAGCHGAGFPARLGDDRLARVHLVEREVGLAARCEVPPTARLRGLRIASRPASAGIVAHFRAALAEAGVDSGEVDARPLATHRDVALEVLRGEADVGVVTRAWAERVGLRFRAFAAESYGLVLRAADLGEPPMVRLCETAQSPAYRRRVAAIPGYDATNAGAIRYDPA